MKRRSVNVRSLALGFFLLFAMAALFTRVLLPLESLILGKIGAYLLRSEAIFEGRSPEPLGPGIHVVGKRANEFQEIFIIDVVAPIGSKVLDGNIFLGTVIASGNALSKVMPISAPSSSLEGVFGRSGIPAHFQGKGAGILEVELPRGTDVVAGETIYSLENLIIGTVVKVADVPSNPFLKVIVSHPTNFMTLKTITLYGR